MSRPLASCLIAVMSVVALGASAPWIASPRQPTRGPGSSDYAYDCVRDTSHGLGALAYRLFEPDCARAQTNPSAPRPLIVFLHGFQLTDPALYSGWIRHLVRRGGVVVFPIFQSGPFDFYPTDNAAVAIRSALDELRQPEHEGVDVSNFTLVGHSLGAGVALNLGAIAGEGRIPFPANIVAVAPALNLDPAAPGRPDRFGFVRDWGLTPALTRVTIVVGEQDQLVGDESAFVAWPHFDHLPTPNRAYVQMRSDDHGSIPLVANHLAPLSPDGLWIPGALEVNADDFLLWGITDALIACPPAQLMDRCPAAPLSVGRWSDGTSMRPALQINAGTPARISTTTGNASSYVFLPIFERLAAWCPYLGSLCGVDPLTAERTRDEL
ncbi:MAG: alpha/beta hydrolase [Vicinamibacterales bacterium]